MDLDRPRIGITMGDPSGIGPEITIKSFENEEIHKECYPFVLGDSRVLEKAKDYSDSDIEIRPFEKLEDLSPDRFNPGKLNVLDFENVNLNKLKIGEVQKHCGQASIDYIERACELCLEGDIHAMVTGPINKQALKEANHPYPGHTETLANQCGVSAKDVTMMLVAKNLRVFHVTLHQSLRSALDSIERGNIVKTIELAEIGLKQIGIGDPKIGIAALNPHASDGGRFGDEERRMIEPAIEEARSEGIDAEGPIPADTLFERGVEGEFDGEVAMYHDQGHIPIKMAGFMEGVNATVGLPIIRTSVDHGTAFDIAGKGKADPHSMIRAIELANIMLEEKEDSPSGNI